MAALTTKGKGWSYPNHGVLGIGINSPPPRHRTHWWYHPGCNPRYCQQEKKNMGLESSPKDQGGLGGDWERPQKSLPHPSIEGHYFCFQLVLHIMAPSYFRIRRVSDNQQRKFSGFEGLYTPGTMLNCSYDFSYTLLQPCEQEARIGPCTDGETETQKGKITFQGSR